MNEVVCTLNSIDSATTAAWVQGIGSLLALAVAILISYLQHRNDLKKEQRTAKAKVIRSLAVGISLGGGVIAKCKVLEAWAISTNPKQHAVNIDFLVAEVKSLTNDLISIDLNEIDHFDALQSISKFKTLSSISLVAIESIANRINSQLIWNVVAINELQRIIPNLEEAMNIAVDLERDLKKQFENT